MADLRFSDEALLALQYARWEGNVRELEAAVRRAILMREGPIVSVQDLGLQAACGTQSETVRPLAMARDEYLRDYVRQIVQQLGGNRTAAAEALYVTLRTVFKYLEQ